MVRLVVVVELDLEGGTLRPGAQPVGHTAEVVRASPIGERWEPGGLGAVR